MCFKCFEDFRLTFLGGWVGLKFFILSDIIPNTKIDLARKIWVSIFK